MIRSLTKKSVFAALVLGLSLSSVACSSNGPAKNVKEVAAAPMPAGGTWDGVYFNARYGELHVTTSGNAVQGVWRRVDGSQWGELYGETDGDALKFQWTEYKVGIVGPNAQTSGHGYFKYSIPGENDAHVLTGEWGEGDDNAGQPWNCTKMMNKEADPKAQRPGGDESQVGAVGFDGERGDGSSSPKKSDKSDKSDKGEKKEADPDSQGL